MKITLSLAAAILLIAPVAKAATLLWEAPGGLAPATGYKIYHSAQFNPPLWTLVGSSVNTNFTVSAGGYYQVTATNSFGESGPSNIATNGFVAPGAPTNAVIRASIEAGNTPNGPWMEVTNIATTVPLASQSQFYRSRLTAELER